MKENMKTTKRAWSSEEDERLRGLVEYYGPSKWTVVADQMGGRTGKQCRERWHNHLDPTVKKGEWTPEEDRIIIEMQAKLGNQWAKITRMLPGRTDNAVKNRWHSSMRNKNKAIRDQAMAIPLPDNPELSEIVRGDDSRSKNKLNGRCQGSRNEKGGKRGEAFVSARGRKIKRHSRHRTIKKAAHGGEDSDDLAIMLIINEDGAPKKEGSVAFSEEETTDESVGGEVEEEFHLVSFLDEAEQLPAKSDKSEALVPSVAMLSGPSADGHGLRQSVEDLAYEPLASDLTPVGALSNGLNEWLDECFLMENPENLLKHPNLGMHEEDIETLRSIDMTDILAEKHMVSSQAPAKVELKKRSRLPCPPADGQRKRCRQIIKLQSLDGAETTLEALESSAPQGSFGAHRVQGYPPPSKSIVFGNSAFDRSVYFPGVMSCTPATLQGL